MTTGGKLASLLLTTVAVSGCNMPSIVGEWESAGFLGGTSSSRYTFQSDGTFSTTLQANPPGMFITIVAEAKGTYQVTGDKINSSVETYMINGVKVDNLETVNEAVREQLKRPLSGVFQWVNPNEITIIQGRFGNTLILKRVRTNPPETEKD